MLSEDLCYEILNFRLRLDGLFANFNPKLGNFLLIKKLNIKISAYFCSHTTKYADYRFIFAHNVHL